MKLDKKDVGEIISSRASKKEQEIMLNLI